MEFNVLFTNTARDDLKSIHEYISFNLLAPEAAANTTRGILAAAQALSSMPKRNPVYRDEPWKSLEVRFTPFKNYMIFYKVDDEKLTVTVSRIMYGGRDITTQLSEDIF